MNVLPGSDPSRQVPSRPPAPWPCVAALAIAAIVVIVTILVTRSADAVTLVAGAMILLLGWFATITSGSNSNSG
jgi:hypothetical protein